jgi:ATP-dependent Clp protease ATP-binding subunit ClpB
LTRSWFFIPLRPEHLEQILDIELCLVQRHILQTTSSNVFAFTCMPEVKHFLLQEGTDPRYGARHMKRAIEKYVLFPLVVGSGQVTMSDVVRIDLDDQGGIVFVKEADGTLLPV